MTNYDVIKGMSSNDLAYVLYSLILPFCEDTDEAEKLNIMRRIKGFLAAPAGEVQNEDTARHTACDVHSTSDR